jgi:glutaconate CoA-transferase subunit B
MCYRGNTSDVVLSMARRLDRVLLDAGTVDVRGRVNSTAIGEYRRASVRLPGGGGAPDVAAAAADLVLLHGGADPQRIQAHVEHVTSRPADGASVRLITRWGVVRLGKEPRLIERFQAPSADGFEDRLREIGVAIDGSLELSRADDASLSAAVEVVTDAAARGYQVAKVALITG